MSFRPLDVVPCAAESEENEASRLSYRSLQAFPREAIRRSFDRLKFSEEEIETETNEPISPIRVNSLDIIET